MRRCCGPVPVRPSARAFGRRLLVAPARWPLAVKLTLAMLATALLPMLATAIYNLEGSLWALEQSQLRKVELIAHNTAGRLAQLLGDTRKLASTMGRDTDFTRWLAQPDTAGRQDLHDKLMSMVNANADLPAGIVSAVGRGSWWDMLANGFGLRGIGLRPS